MFKFTEGISETEIMDKDIVNSMSFKLDSNMSFNEATAFWNKQFDFLSEISIRDICDWIEEDFSFEYDISDMKDITDKFDNKKWGDLSEDERLEVVKDFVSKISEMLGVENVPETSWFVDDESVQGVFYSGINILGLNKCELNKPSELMNTIAHELRHAYQEQHASNPDTKMDYLYKINLANYISPMYTENGECILFNDYYNQLVEAEARAFADYFCKEVIAA